MRIFFAALMNALSTLPMAFSLAYVLELAGIKFGEAYAGIFLSAAIGAFLFAKFTDLPIFLFPNYAVVSSFIYIEVICEGTAVETLLFASFAAALVGASLEFFNITPKIAKFFREKFFRENLTSAFLFGIALYLILEGLNLGRLVTTSPFTFAMIGDFSPVASFALFGVILSLLLYTKYKNFAIILPVGLIILFSYLEGYIAIEEIFRLPQIYEIKPTFELNWDFFRLTFKILFFMTIISSFYQYLFDKIFESENAKLSCVFGTNVFSPFLGAFMLTPSLFSTIGMSVCENNKKVSYATALFFVFFAFLEPLSKSLADFPAIYAPAIFTAGIFTLSKVRNIFGENFAENVAGAAFILLFPITRDIATAFACSFVLLILLKVSSKNRSFSFFLERKKEKEPKRKRTLL